MTSFVFNVTFDCADPERQAEFWSAVTGYEITEVRDDFARLRTTDPRGVRHILFFKVPEPKTAKSRMHVDLATRDTSIEIPRLLELGATFVDSDSETVWRTGNGTKWVVLRDPEGNEFCIG